MLLLLLLLLLLLYASCLCWTVAVLSVMPWCWCPFCCLWCCCCCCLRCCCCCLRCCHHCHCFCNHCCFTGVSKMRLFRGTMTSRINNIYRRLWHECRRCWRKHWTNPAANDEDWIKNTTKIISMVRTAEADYTNNTVVAQWPIMVERALLMDKLLISQALHSLFIIPLPNLYPSKCRCVLTRTRLNYIILNNKWLKFNSVQCTHMWALLS